MRQPNPDAKLTARQLATVLGVSPQLVNRWRTFGWIDPVTKERRYLQVADRNTVGDRRYRYLDGAQAEAATRKSDKSFRKTRQLAAA